jgi:hypothetical protein
MTMHQLLSEEQYYQAQDDFGEDSFTAKIGAEAMKHLLMELDLPFEKVSKCVRICAIQEAKPSAKSWLSG